ncbi:hypothetical protein [Streptomyces sp. NPDC059092]|uniref:hypothetical protein n=1 Tax=Streptomyces sp. NPDC059092 TaxID=3346725 RepID=UPI003686E573
MSSARRSRRAATARRRADPSGRYGVCRARAWHTPYAYAVSLYVRDASGTATGHRMGLRTSYIAPTGGHLHPNDAGMKVMADTVVTRALRCGRWRRGGTGRSAGVTEE